MKGRLLRLTKTEYLGVMLDPMVACEIIRDRAEKGYVKVEDPNQLGELLEDMVTRFGPWIVLTVFHFDVLKYLNR